LESSYGPAHLYANADKIDAPESYNTQLDELVTYRRYILDLEENREEAQNTEEEHYSSADM